jgi:mannose/fructose/N-acetylgalactosamine-specific phosphotransferase system component IIC
MELVITCIAIGAFGLVSAIIEAMIEVEPQLEKKEKKLRNRTQHHRSR